MKSPKKSNVEKARNNYLAVLKKIKMEKAIALKKWSDAAIKATDKVLTLEEAKKAFQAAPWGTLAKLYTLAKWAELCTTIDELKEAYKVSHKRISCYDQQNPAFEKWNNMLCIDSFTATNFREAGVAFCEMPKEYYNKEARKKAFAKWLSFCQTLKDLGALYDGLGQHIPFEDLYQQKRNEIYLKEKGCLAPKSIPFAMF